MTTEYTYTGTGEPARVGQWVHTLQIHSDPGMACLDMITRDNGWDKPMDLRGPLATPEAAQAEASRLNGGATG